MARYELAQLNIARMLAPLDSATMAEFRAGLEPMNRLADVADGFVWRWESTDGDGTAGGAFGDASTLVNLSVWRDIDALRAYAYRSEHADYIKRRREWFSRMAEAFAALWWVPAGHRPTVTEAVQRLQHLRDHGPSDFAFTFAQLFPSPAPAFASPLVVSALTPNDRESWEVLARGYKLFYNTPTSDNEYETAWQRIMANQSVHGLGAKVDGELVGITHYLFHASTWAESACYLQDLFSAPEYRGRGIARALIAAVAEKARERGASRCYWLTHHSNATARTLYDKVATYHGFIRYDVPMT